MEKSPYMIVNAHLKNWEGILQRAHAFIAYGLLLNFRQELRSARWAAVLQAALTHDHGWREWDEAGLDADGHPSNFTDSPSALAQRLAQRSVELASYQCPEGAILVARHMEELYQNRPEPDLLKVIEGIQQWRFQQMKRVNWTSTDVESDYEYVYWADSASLTLCVQDPEFVAHLPLRLHDTEYTMKEVGEVWTMTPWPYESPKLDLGVDLYDFPSVLTTDSELCEVIQSGAKRRKTWLLGSGEGRFSFSD